MWRSTLLCLLLLTKISCVGIVLNVPLKQSEETSFEQLHLHRTFKISTKGKILLLFCSYFALKRQTGIHDQLFLVHVHLKYTQNLLIDRKMMLYFSGSARFLWWETRTLFFWTALLGLKGGLTLFYCQTQYAGYQWILLSPRIFKFAACSLQRAAAAWEEVVEQPWFVLFGNECLELSQLQ